MKRYTIAQMIEHAEEVKRISLDLDAREAGPAMRLADAALYIARTMGPVATLMESMRDAIALNPPTPPRPRRSKR